VKPMVDFAATMDHVRGVIDAIAPNDSVERFEKLGVRVLRTTARFVAPDTVEAGGERIRARRFVIASGSRPTAPPIPGLDSVPFLTNETVFANRQRPEHLVVIGGGPIGMEMAQAHRRLGARVTVLEAAAILGKDDPEMAAIVTARLKAEGVVLRDQAKITRVSGTTGAIAIEIDGGERIEASHLLVAAGRAPNIEDLDLDKAGVAFTRRGITVDKGLRTSNRRIYAIGDVNGLHPFTHMASFHGSLVIRNALFRLPVNVHATALPWTTYTDPEIAQVGLTEAQAREQHGDRIRIVRWPLHENDRAQTERETAGLVKVVADKRGHVLGAGIVAPRAGELIHVWCLAMAGGLKLGNVAQMVVPYPTLGEASKRAAGSFFTDALFSPRTRWLVGLLQKLP
jgi:pyruvate/2-oxoglutarate dehydrogenase complex dihydrolipoamide dehydrogenase (E3) component